MAAAAGHGHLTQNAMLLQVLGQDLYLHLLLSDFWAFVGIHWLGVPRQGFELVDAVVGLFGVIPVSLFHEPDFCLVHSRSICGYPSCQFQYLSVNPPLLCARICV